PDTPRISVRGEARLEVDPEIAHIHITVTARNTDRTTTLEELTRRNTRALDLIKTYGNAVEKLETGLITVAPHLTGKGRHEHVRSYHGSVHLTATLGDFTILGELTTNIADLPLTEITGPWWSLRPDSPAHREARRLAVQEAVQRAREYADALGSRLTALLELADDGAEGHGIHGYAGGMARGGYGAGSAPGPETELDLEPQRQTVHAQVNARFTITPPQL
ncbi:SIMPL domain-containing protein, partial [Streptomyces sp. URMC 127]|uniref:SIMPL domain-containing protein n=1 Tax=Streptomyces sp. URMC 127 TaxID=3423402 RepID=UPI003F1CD7B0